MMIATRNRGATIIIVLIFFCLIFPQNTASEDLEYKDVSDFIQIWVDGMGVISSGEYSPDGSMFALGSRYGTISIFSSSDYELQRRLILRNTTVEHLDWSHDGSRIAAGSEDGIVILNSTTGGKIKHLDVIGRMEYLEWSPVDYRIAVDIFGEVLILDSITGETLLFLPGIRHMSWNPNGEQIAYTTGTEVSIIN
jgi:WD40 repeat protein